jgi:hypothetical protein
VEAVYVNHGSVDIRVIFTKKRVIAEKTTVVDGNKYTKGKGKGNKIEKRKN